MGTSTCSNGIPVGKPAQFSSPDQRELVPPRQKIPPRRLIGLLRAGCPIVWGFPNPDVRRDVWDPRLTLSDVARGLARQSILDQLGHLLSFQPFVQTPDAIREHHRMRIAAKHLRYTLEIFQPAYGEAFQRPLESARDLQTLLGELHDCDVWISYLPDFLAARRGPARESTGRVGSVGRIAAGIERLRQDRPRQRRMLYRQYVRMWESLKREHVWEDLEEVLEVLPPAGPAGKIVRPHRKRPARRSR